MTDRLIDRITGLLKKRQWYEQPRLLAMFRLGEIRNDLREKNLHDTEDPLLKRADPGVQLDPAVRNSRSTDGTNNDLLYPAMGSVGRRFGRNVPLEHVVPDNANLMVPSPQSGQPRAHDPRPVSAGVVPQPARRVVDPVPGPRLVRAQALEDAARRYPAGARRQLGRADDARAEHRARFGAARIEAAAGLRQPEQPLVGLLAAVRLRCRDREASADDDRRQAEDRADRPPAGRSGQRHQHQRLHRQLVDRPGHAPHALHVGAQLHLRSAGPPQSDLDRRADLRQGAADHHRARREDPHRRVDMRDHAASDHQDRHEHELVRPARGRPAGCHRLHRRQRDPRRHHRIEGRPSRRAILADRGVRRRLPHAPADAGRDRLQVAGDRPRPRDTHARGDHAAAARRRSPSA